MWTFVCVVRRTLCVNLILGWILLHSAIADLIPSFLTEPESIVVKQHGHVTLDCSVTPTSAVVRWFHNGEYLDVHNVPGYELQGTSLHIGSFRHDVHVGVYHCIGQTSQGSIRSRLAILYKPLLRPFNVTSEFKVINASIGGTNVLPCVPPKSSPPADIVFLRNGVQVQEDDKHKVMPSGSLQVSDVQLSDHGIYKCVAVNPVNSRNHTSPQHIKLNVKPGKRSYSKPTVFGPTSETVQVPLRTNVILECIGEGTPPLVYSWHRYGGHLPQDKITHILGNLKIADIQAWDEGTIICEIRDSLGRTAQKVFHISVIAPPVVKITDSNLVAIVGDRVTIPCDVKQEGHEQPILHWYHNATGIHTGDDINIQGTKLVITSVRHNQAGLYQCVASSVTGRGSAVAKLEVRPRGSHLNDGRQSDPDPLGNENNNGDNVGNPGDTLDILDIDKATRRRWTDRKRKRPARKKGRLEEEDAMMEAPGVDVTKLTETAVRLDWEVDEVDRADVQFYRIEYKESSPNRGDWETLDVDIPNDKQKYMYEVSGLSLGSEYRFRIVAVYDNGDLIPGPKSRRFMLDYDDEDTDILDMVPPSRPDVTKLSDTSVRLDWLVEPNDGLEITFFRVQYKEVRPHRGDWETTDDDIHKARRKYEVSGLTPGTTYKFRIVAVYTNNDNRHGEESRRFTLERDSAGRPIRPADKPIIVVVRPVTHNNIHALFVQWQYHPKERTRISGFRIKYKPHYSAEDFKTIPLFEPGIRSHIIKNLTADTSYEIRMTAFNIGGDSDYSNTVVRMTDGPTGPVKPYNINPYPKPPVIDQPPPHRTEPKIGQPPNMQPDLPGSDGDSPFFVPPPVTATPSTDRNSEAEEHHTKTSTQSSSEMLYMILGIVLGILMLLLVIFMVMCGIKQRQQRRMMAAMNDEVGTKYQDSAARIYADTHGKKYMNGGFALNGINVTLPNGHADPRKMNISVNPMSDMDMRQMQPQDSGDGSGSQRSAIQRDTLNSMDRSKHYPTSQPPSLPPHSNVSTFASHQYAQPLERRSPMMLPGGPPLHNHYAVSSPYVEEEDEFDRPSQGSPIPPEHLHHMYQVLMPDEGRPIDHRPVSPPSGVHHHHRRRRKRPVNNHEQQLLQQPVRDMATNTDISSNEGTLESSSTGPHGNLHRDYDTDPHHRDYRDYDPDPHHTIPHRDYDYDPPTEPHHVLSIRDFEYDAPPEPPPFYPPHIAHCSRYSPEDDDEDSDLGT